MEPLKPPTKLKSAGRKLWVGLTNGEFEFNSAELRILEDACREVDLIDQMEKEIQSKDFKMVVRGSQGQPVASPVVQEIRQHRMTLRALIQALKLPEEDDGRATSAGQVLAMQRWGNGA